MKLKIFTAVFFCYLLSACSQSVLYAPKAELATKTITKNNKGQALFKNT
jgi:hypothetical protein